MNREDQYLYPTTYDYPRISRLIDRDAAVVRIEAGDVTVTGSSRRNPDDEPDQKTGELLAMARAYNKLAHKLAKKADARVNHAAEIKRHKEERRSKQAQPCSLYFPPESVNSGKAAVITLQDNARNATYTVTVHPDTLWTIPEGCTVTSIDWQEGDQ